MAANKVPVPSPVGLDSSNINSRDTAVDMDRVVAAAVMAKAAAVAVAAMDKAVAVVVAVMAKAVAVTAATDRAVAVAVAVMVVNQCHKVTVAEWEAVVDTAAVVCRDTVKQFLNTEKLTCI